MASVTVSPLPGSRDATPQTQISFLGVPAGESERGQRRRARAPASHSGRLVAYSQGDGAQLPAGAAVRRRRARDRARAAALRGRSASRCSTGSRSPPGPDQLDARGASTPGSRSRSPELPLAPGPASAGARGDRAARRPCAPGDVFAAPYAGPGQAGPMILDPDGGLVWFKPLPRDTSATNLARPGIHGQPGADVVAGRHLDARLRARRRRDRDSAYTTSRTSAPATACRPTCTSSS